MGRELDKETEAHRTAIKEMTGHEVLSCPWRSFTHPLVRDVMSALQFFESGNLALAIPDPSHRLMEGITCWQQAYNHMHAKEMELEREKRKREAAK